MGRTAARKSLTRPKQRLVNSTTGKVALHSKQGVIRGDDADQWLAENDPEHGTKIARRRPFDPPPEVWMQSIRSAEPGFPEPVVYFIQGADGGPVKIGRSQSYASCQTRLLEIQVGNPSLLVIRRIIVHTTRMERRLHMHFEHLRVRGEWFAADDELRAIAHCL